MQKIKDLYEVFNSPALIHMKYMNLHMYVIKRMSHLIVNPEDYNPEGCGGDFHYQGSTWNEGFPSDPEIISSIFTHLLDFSFFGKYPSLHDWGKRNYTINHLISYN
jgi:hypothetical protein